jgi:hypothetical protein
MQFYDVTRMVIVMMRRGFVAKQLQKMIMRIHNLKKAIIKRLETTTVAYDRVLLNFDDRCEEFSCSSTPVKGIEKRYLHFLLSRALPCVCLTAQEDQYGSNNVISIHYQEQQQQFSCVDESPQSPMDDFSSPQVDRRAEEFITAFYMQMRLQRQDSYQQYQEMLARAT